MARRVSRPNTAAATCALAFECVPSNKLHICRQSREAVVVLSAGTEGSAEAAHRPTVKQYTSKGVSALLRMRVVCVTIPHHHLVWLVSATPGGYESQESSSC